MSTHSIFSATEKTEYCKEKEENKEDCELETMSCLSDGCLIVCTEKTQNIAKKKEENREDYRLETAGKL